MIIDNQFTASNWYWIVAGSTTQVYSSKAKSYVPVSNPVYVAWLAMENLPTRINSEASLLEVLAEQAPDCLPDNAEGIRARQDNLIGKLAIEKIGIVVATALFKYENRIRVLEGKQPVTKAQFIVALKALL